MSGAAFIKWAQWAAVREDLFPPEFCEAMSQLHDQAPTHSFAATQREVRYAFGVEVSDLFKGFDEKPLASGSIAQVHLAVIK